MSDNFQMVTTLQFDVFCLCPWMILRGKCFERSFSFFFFQEGTHDFFPVFFSTEAFQQFLRCFFFFSEAGG